MRAVEIVEQISAIHYHHHQQQLHRQLIYTQNTKKVNVFAIIIITFCLFLLILHRILSSSYQE